MLIFFGGVDKDNLTARALKALTCTALECIAVDVVIGRQSPHKAEIEELAAKRPHTTLHWQLSSLAGLIARADLAIGAGGTTTWERICLKLPSLVVVVASNQLPFAQSLAKAGYIKLLGEERDTTTEQIRSTLLKSITMPIPQDEIGDLTDGWGAERIAIAMIGLHKAPSLQSACASDKEHSSYWSEDKKPGEISKSENIYASRNSTQAHHIVTSLNGCPIGQIVIDRKPSKSDIVHRNCMH